MRTGRATPALVDTLRIDVESYDSSMSLKELANIAVTEGNVIIIKPFDPSTLKDIQRGIEKSGLGINPQNDGKMIRLPVPPLSGERRNQLTNHIKQLAEQQKVAVRTSRRDANKSFDAAKKAKTGIQFFLRESCPSIRALLGRRCQGSLRLDACKNECVDRRT